MTPRERVICALEHRSGEAIPWTIELTQVEHEKLVAATGNPDIERSFGSHIAAAGIGSMAPPARPAGLSHRPLWRRVEPHRG